MNNYNYYDNKEDNMHRRILKMKDDRLMTGDAGKALIIFIFGVLFISLVAALIVIIVQRRRNQ